MSMDAEQARHHHTGEKKVKNADELDKENGENAEKNAEENGENAEN